MAANPATAHVVGNAFVNQYYNVLHTSPQVVHRFYTDLSRLTRAEAGPDGHVETVMTQNDIFNKVMSLDYTDFKAEIKTVDSQDSLNGGVLVMVTGSLSNKTSKKRNFVQIFFLAPQEKGYFVLNDVFRYLDDDVPPPLNTPYVLENGIQERVPVSEPVEASVTGEQEVTEHPSPVASEEEVPEEAYDIHDQAEISEPEEEQTPQESAPPELPPPVQETALPAYEPATSTLEEAQGEQPKKSYASILRKVSPVQPHIVAPKPAVAKPSPAPIVDRSTASPPVALSAAIAPQVPDGFDESIPAESEGNGRSIYIKNLPMNITEAQLETEFARFGTIKPNAIQVRTFKQQGYCYAFVEFEDPQSALNAVEANTIAIGGRQASIESKKPSSSGSRGGQGGRGQAGRGAFRGDSRGGRGGYYGGRGQGRGSGQDRGGRGFTGPRGGYSGYSNAGDDGYRRYDSQSGNGPRQQKRGGAQMPRNGSNPQGSTSE